MRIALFLGLAPCPLPPPPLYLHKREGEGKIGGHRRDGVVRCREGTFIEVSFVERFCCDTMGWPNNSDAQELSERERERERERED